VAGVVEAGTPVGVPQGLADQDQGVPLEAQPPHLGREVPADAIRVADVLRRENVALRCAQRALDIVAANRLDAYRDATPIYVRLAEAEVKLQQKRNG